MGRLSLTILQLKEIIHLKISVDILQNDMSKNTIFCITCKQFWYSVKNIQLIDLVLG
jgi:hypothetical protein